MSEQLTVTKRDGRKVPFDSVRIYTAITKAMKETERGIDEDAAHVIADSITNECITGYVKPTVESIQDQVERKLMSIHPEAAKAYILYRDNRAKERTLNRQLMEKVWAKTNASEIENSNANIDEHSFAGRKNEAANIIQKAIAIEMNMPKDIANAVKAGFIYEHDLDHYNLGAHNCLQIDFEHVLANGFKARNGDVRSPSSFSTACQQVAVIMQIQSQCQFGGVGSIHIDYDLAPYVKNSFKRHFNDGIKYIEPIHEQSHIPAYRKVVEDIESNDVSRICIDNEQMAGFYPKAYAYAMDMLEREGRQAAEALYHNLLTLESRPGGQVPFTSLNMGRDTSTEGRLVTRWLLEASIAGVGQHHLTPIFPITIFCLKRGVNMAEGDPNYDLKLLAIKSMSKRIYPNFVNCDWSEAHEDDSDKDTIFSTMGCVDGREKLSYVFQGGEYYEPFVAMWNRVADVYEPQVQRDGKRVNLYIKPKYTQVYDSKEGCWVIVKTLIRNVSDSWVEVKVAGIVDPIKCTTDHPFETVAGIVKPACELNPGRDLLYFSHDKRDNPAFGEAGSVSFVEEVRYLPREFDFSYDVETESSHFDVAGLWSHNCRTMIGYDRHGMGYKRVGRGNNVPITIILPKLGIEYGICQGKREQSDFEGFWKAFEDTLKLTEKALLERFAIMCRQKSKAALFMYENGTIADANKCRESVYEALKHNTLAIGFIGGAELCQAMFGENHVHSEDARNFLLEVVRRINTFAKEASDRNDLNFSCYATPAEGLCHTALNTLRDQYGVIPHITDREYLTNSFHVPVWESVDIYTKLKIESPFTKYCTGGTITYIECESTFMQNLKAVENVIDYMFSPEMDIPYAAFNFPIDGCNDCGYEGEFDDACPECSSENIRQLRRVTGYLSTDARRFNQGKQQEVHDRVKHTAYTKLGEST